MWTDFFRRFFAGGSAEGFSFYLEFNFFMSEGSAEGFCERFCGRFLQKVFMKGFSAEGFRKDSGRFWAFIPAFPHPESFLWKVPRKAFAEGSSTIQKMRKANFAELFLNSFAHPVVLNFSHENSSASGIWFADQSKLEERSTASLYGYHL